MNRLFTKIIISIDIRQIYVKDFGTTLGYNALPICISLQIFPYLMLSLKITTLVILP